MLDYYILVQHRNHLGVLSPSGADMLCGGVTIDWDFTLANSYEPAIRYGQKEIEPGIWAMHAGNGDQLANITPSTHRTAPHGEYCRMLWVFSGRL
ncbi:MAG: hypothetical protein IPN60_15825 [Saprospiraceae bacterium]|nr:hypothetical protein [Candidatus Opimibacter skivensis]